MSVFMNRGKAVRRYEEKVFITVRRAFVIFGLDLGCAAAASWLLEELLMKSLELPRNDGAHILCLAGKVCSH